MEEFIYKIADFGALGVIAGLALWEQFRLSNKIFDIMREALENNTKSISELRDIIRSSKVIYKEK